MKMWKKALGVLLAGALLASGCGSNAGKKESSKTIPELKIAISPY